MAVLQRYVPAKWHKMADIDNLRQNNAPKRRIHAVRAAFVPDKGMKRVNIGDFVPFAKRLDCSLVESYLQGSSSQNEGSSRRSDQGS